MAPRRGSHKHLIAVALLALSACAFQTDVVPIGGDLHMVGSHTRRPL